MNAKRLQDCIRTGICMQKVEETVCRQRYVCNSEIYVVNSEQTERCMKKYEETAFGRIYVCSET